MSFVHSFSVHQGRIFAVPRPLGTLTMGIVISFRSIYLPFPPLIFHLTNDISLLLDLGILPLDELFGSLVVHKLSLTWVLCAFASSPDLVLKATLLAFLVRKSAVRVEARVEPALGLDVSEFAVGICAASAVSTEGH